MHRRGIITALGVLVACGTQAWGDTVVATRTIRALSVIQPEDVDIVAEVIPGALTHPEDAIGLEARVSLYAGRPIRPGDLAVPALIERNQIIPLIYRNGTLTIKTAGRALARGGEGEAIRVLNLSSKVTVTATVDATGAAVVGSY